MIQHSRSTEETPTFQSIQTLVDHPPKVKLLSLQHMVDIGRLVTSKIWKEEVKSLVGERHIPKVFGTSGEHYYLWDSNPGLIRIDGERVPIDVPSVRDVNAGEEQPLENDQATNMAEAPTSWSR